VWINVSNGINIFSRFTHLFREGPPFFEDSKCFSQSTSSKLS
jgi:hypothetical protein